MEYWLRSECGDLFVQGVDSKTKPNVFVMNGLLIVFYRKERPTCKDHLPWKLLLILSLTDTDINYAYS